MPSFDKSMAKTVLGNGQLGIARAAWLQNAPARQAHRKMPLVEVEQGYD
jgi:hypothetical protein